MEISADMVRELRQRTGIGVMECKAALREAEGDQDKAIEILRKKGYSRAQGKMSRTASEGLVGSYIHMNGRIGVLVELNCESDFVARNEEYQELLKNICLQVAAANPKYIAPEDVPAAVLEQEKEIVRAQFQESKKPAEIVEKIVLGKLQKFYGEVCLLDQVYIKDDKITIRQLIQSAIAKIGENIKVGRFARFEVGKD